MTYHEIAVAFGLKNAKRLHDFQTKFEQAIIKKLQEEKERPKKHRRRRPPEWCLPPWERKDGRQHIVYCTAQRPRRDKHPITAYWVWVGGRPVVKSDTMDGAKSLAKIRAMMYETYVWDAEDWEKEKAANPQIEEVLKAYE